jgi:hypothetical protein
VDDAGLDAQGIERVHATHAEQRVLRQAGVRVAVVQARGDPAVEAVVLRQQRVEQEQRHAADVQAPHLGDHVALADRDR